MIWKDGQFIESDPEVGGGVELPVLPGDELLTFTRSELEQFIADYITEFLSEGPGGGSEE